MIRVLLISLALALTVVACSRVKDTTPPPTPLEAYQEEVQLRGVWQADTGNAFNRRQVVLRPLILDDAVLVANVGGQLTAINRHNGIRKWRSEAGAWLSSGVGGVGDQVYTGTREGELIAWSATDGSERWRRQMGGELLATPSADENRVVVRTADGRVVSLDPADGSRQWTHSHSVPSLSLRGNARAMLVGGGVLVGQDDGRVVALAEDDGEVLWRAQVGEASGRTPIERMIDVDGRIAVGHGAIFAASYQGEMARIEPAEGRVEWSRSLSSYRGMTVDDNNVYVTDAESHILAIDPGSGAGRWRQDRLAHRGLTAPVPIPDTNWLVVADMEGYVHLLSRSDGRLIGRYRTGNRGIVADPVIDPDGRIFVQTRGAKLHVLQTRARD